METRIYRVTVKTPGGNASKNAKGYGITLPSKWLNAMKISEEDREVLLSFDGEVITIKKAGSAPTNVVPGEQPVEE